MAWYHRWLNRAKAKKRSEPNHDLAARGRRFAGWRTHGGGANTAIFGDLAHMRNRSRDLMRKNPWAVSPMESLVANLVGEGIRAYSRVEDEGLRKAIDSLWRDWSKECDADGILHFGGMQQLAVRCMIESGEALARLRFRLPEDGMLVPLQVQLMEPDHLPIDKTETRAGRNTITAGIERNRLGKRIAYHLYRTHPGDSLALTQTLDKDTVRVLAAEVLHLYEPKRIGQLRGTPWIAPAGVRMRDMMEYEDATLVRQKVEAMIAGFITRPDADNVLNEDDDDGDGIFQAELEPGTMQYLNAGEDVTFNNPSSVGNGYEPFIKHQLRATAATTGSTYEQVSGDLSGVNFSSIRFGGLEFQRRAKPRQQMIIHQFCWPIRKAWMDVAVEQDMLPIDRAAYAADPSPYLRTEWQAPGWQYVNPKDEATAAKLMLDAGLTSRHKIAADMGYDIDEIDEQRKRDEDREKKLGIWVDPLAEKEGPGRPVGSAKAKARMSIVE